MPNVLGSNIAVLGATGALGGAIQTHLHRQGANVYALGRSVAKLEKLGDVSAATIVLDLRRPELWPDAIKALPVLDGVVIATGKMDILPVAVLNSAKFSEALELNLIAPAMLVRELLRSQKMRGGASIVFMGSISGIRGAAGHAAYAASKAGLLGFVRTLALELSSRGIRVNTVSPGLVDDGMGAAFRGSVTAEQFDRYAQIYPLGLGKADDIVGAVEFLLSGSSRWITGHDLVVDGGATLK